MKQASGEDSSRHKDFKGAERSGQQRGTAMHRAKLFDAERRPWKARAMGSEGIRENRIRRIEQLRRVTASRTSARARRAAYDRQRKRFVRRALLPRAPRRAFGEAAGSVIPRGPEGSWRGQVGSLHDPGALGGRDVGGFFFHHGVTGFGVPQDSGCPKFLDSGGAFSPPTPVEPWSLTGMLGGRRAETCSKIPS